MRQSGDPINDPNDSERAFNARATLDTLKNVADWFGSVRGRRKAILFVSEGIDYDIHDIIPGTGSTHRGASMILDSTRDAIAAATRSNVAIYGIDPRGLTDLGDESIEIQSFPDDTSLGIGPGSLQNELRLSQDSLRTLSDETGGFAVVNQNDFASAFQRIVEDNSSYYVLAYYPPDARPGRYHKIEVRVSRPDLIVRARRGHVTPKKAAAVTTKSTQPGDARSEGGARQPAAGQRPDDARVRGAVQGDGAERVGAVRRRDARPRPAAEPRTRSCCCRISRSTRTARSAAATPMR